MACNTGVAAAIVSDCTTQLNGGVETTAWIFNRLEMTLTYDGTSANKITNIAAVGAAKMFHIHGVKKSINAGHDVVVSDMRSNMYKHSVEFQQFERLAANILNVDNLNDVCVIVEAKDKSTTGEGVFFAYGVKHGLYVSADTLRHQADNGARKITLESMGGEEEPYSEFTVLKTDYATTLAALNALC